MTNDTVKLVGDASFEPIKTKRGKYVLHQNGSIALVFDFGQDGQFVGYLQLNGSARMRMSYEDLRFGAGSAGPRGVELKVERVVITVSKAHRAAPESISTGFLVITEDGTSVVATHWDENEGTGLVNLHNGQVSSFVGNQPSLVSSEWTVAGYSGEDQVFELDFSPAP
jgi:hypothetical protein